MPACSLWREGIYSYNGTINGRDYWIKVGGGRAIWYYPQFKDWAIGEEKKLGSNFRSITSYSESTCPNNSKNGWKYYDNGWISTNDVQLNCIGNHNHTKLFKLIAKKS